MMIPRSTILLNMNIHPVRAAFSRPSIPAESTRTHLPTTDDFTASSLPGPETGFAPPPTDATNSIWSIPSHYLPISSDVALAVDVIVLILGLSLVLLGAFYLRRQYRMRKFRALIADANAHRFTGDPLPTAHYPTMCLERDGNHSLASRLKMGGCMSPSKKFRFGKKKNHVRWGSDVTWDAECGKRSSWDGKVKPRHAKSLSLGEDEADVGMSAGKGPLVVDGNEKQTRINLRGHEGFDSFRGV